MSSIDLQLALRNHFGFTAFRPGQQAAIEYILAHRDTLVVMPTGAGKSLIYQLAALMLPGTALVFSPLIALMKDQVDSLTRKGIPATFINSSLDTTEQTRRISLMRDGTFKLVLIAPERLRQLSFRAALKQVRVSLIAVDEAHCLSQWGHDFRPDYLHIGQARTDFRVPVTLALTATATQPVQADITRLLGLAHMERIVTGFNRPNLMFEVFSASDVIAKLKIVQKFLAGENGAGIIYTGTRRDAEEVAEFIREIVGLEAKHYHGLVDSDLRIQIQDEFMTGDLQIVVATNAFGMGIDRPDVRFVLHYTLPSSLEHYYQEAGRAGRDGLPARASLIYSPKDTALQEYFIKNDSPSAAELRDVHKLIHQKSHGLSFADLERDLGLPQTKARVAIEQLEAAGAIQRKTDEAFTQMQFESLELSEVIVRTIAAQVAARHENKRRQLQAMINYSTTNTCRRRLILDHFCDKEPPDAPLCCDNCKIRSATASHNSQLAQTRIELAALIVFDTIAHLKWEVGITTLAQILKGSLAKKMMSGGYDHVHNYGKFGTKKLFEVKKLIDQLFESGYLKQIGGKFPTIKLTPLGEETLKARAAIKFHQESTISEDVQRVNTQNLKNNAIARTEQESKQGQSSDKATDKLGKAPYSSAETNQEMDQISKIVEMGDSRSLVHVPELIKALSNSNGNIRRLAASALGKLKADSGVEPLLKLLGNENKPQVRQYAINALGRIGSIQALTILEHIVNDPQEIEYNHVAAKSALMALNRSKKTPLSFIKTMAKQSDPSHADPIESFLSRPHPQQLNGPWLAGWALDYHSRYDGDVARRSTIGELVFNYKYCSKHQLAQELAGYWVELLASHPELPKCDAVIPMPPSESRKFDPVSNLAQALASHIKVQILFDTLTKTRSTRPQKEMTSMTQKQANVAGAFKIKGNVCGQHLILLDDLFDSGATLIEAAQVMQRGGAASIVVLTLTKTIHSTA